MTELQVRYVLDKSVSRGQLGESAWALPACFTAPLMALDVVMHDGLAHGRAPVVRSAAVRAVYSVNLLYLELYAAIIGQLDDAERRRVC